MYVYGNNSRRDNESYNKESIFFPKKMYSTTIIV